MYIATSTLMKFIRLVQQLLIFFFFKSASDLNLAHIWESLTEIIFFYFHQNSTYLISRSKNLLVVQLKYCKSH